MLCNSPISQPYIFKDLAAPGFTGWVIAFFKPSKLNPDIYNIYLFRIPILILL